MMTKLKKRNKTFYLRKFGSFGMAQSTLQPMCSQYIHKEGMLSFLDQKKYRFFSTQSMILSQPLCLKKNQSTIIGDFLKKYSNASFIQVDQTMAELLKKQFGYYIIPFGLEHLIDLDEFKYNWKLRPNLIRYKNKFSKINFITNEISFTDEYKFRCKKVSELWLKGKKHKEEQSFLTRPLTFENEENVRIFVLENKSEIAAFLTLDPIYSENNISGYMLNHLRYNPAYPKGATYGLIAGVIDQLKKEQCKLLNLGLAPYGNDDFLGSDLLYIKYILNFLYNQNSLFYNFKGIRHMKESFKARKQPTYLAFKSKLPLIDCIKLHQAFIKGRVI